MKYTGDVVCVTVPGQTLIILNSLKAAIDLLDKRSAAYAARPDLILSGRMLGWDQTIILSQPHQPRFRDMRRQMHRYIGSRDAMIKFRKLQTQEMHKSMKRLMRDPDHFADHVRE